MSAATTWDFAYAIEMLAQEKSALASSPEKELIALVVATEVNVVALGATAERTPRQSVLAVLSAGYALQALKKMPREQGWVVFIAEHLAELSRASIYRYLKVAKSFPDPKGLPKDISIMDAYRLSGVLKGNARSLDVGSPGPSATDVKTPPPPPTGGDFPTRIRGMAKFFGAFEAGDVVAATGPESRQALAEEVGALVTVLSHLRSALLKP